MKVLYLDCGMGAAGDMLTAALIELFPDREEIVKKLNSLGVPGVEYVLEKSVKCGITGSHIRVLTDGEEEGEHGHSHDHGDHDHGHGHDHGDHDHGHGHDHGEHHHHHSLADIDHIIKDHLDLPDGVREDVLKVFGMIARAESHVHDKPVPEIHFHEVGTMDAVADVTAVCFLLNELKVKEIIASPIHVGYGKVKCAHGILPVPAPATAYILQGIPVYGGKVEGELCTPTGAALLKHFVTRFGDMPVMKLLATGYGMGTKDFEAANCVRVMLGETAGGNDNVTGLFCNVDDMTAEDMGYAVEKLFEAGTLEAYTTPAGMKKGRPGLVLNVICRPEDADRLAELIFRHTSTIGIRRTSFDRYVLERACETINTPYGEVRKKVSEGYGVRREKYEYEDLVRLADENDMSISKVRKMIDEH